MVIAGGLGNQLFQIVGALSATDQVVHVVTCIGNPKLHEGKLEVSSLDFQGRVQFIKCEKRHYLAPLAFRAMLSLATTKGEKSDQSSHPKALLLLSAAILSAHLRKLVYPRVSKGVGFDPKFSKNKGNLFIGYFQTHRISPAVGELIKNALDNLEKKQWKSSKKAPKVLIHVRLGDYKTEPTFGVLNSTYFSSALELLEKQGPIYGISVFSDESKEALKAVPSHYLDRITVEEFREESPLMTLCRMRGYESYIISNSSFSWWAAFTSTPKNVFVPNPWFINRESPNQLLPESWMKVARS